MHKYKVVQLVRESERMTLTIWSNVFPGNTFLGDCECGEWQRKDTTDWGIQKAWADHVRDKHWGTDGQAR